MAIETTRLVASEGSAQVFLPADNRLGTDWIAPGFDDSTWMWADMGLGYDRTLAPELPREDVTQPGDWIDPTSGRETILLTL